MNAPQAEKALLAACLHKREALVDARMMVEEEDFFGEHARVIWRALCAMHDAGRAIDPVSVLGWLSEARPDAREPLPVHFERPDMFLADLMGATFTLGGVEEYARQMRGARAVRSLTAIGTRLVQASEEIADFDKLLDVSAQQLVQLMQVVDTPLGAHKVRGRVEDLAAWLNVPDDPNTWVIPGLIDVQDAMMFLGGEGSGKSYLLRQFAVCLASGIHPFTLRRIDPGRALLIDVENAASMIRRHLRPLSHQAARLGDWDTSRFELITRPEGINLRKRADRNEIERAIAEFRPDLICMGPLYKLAPRGRDDWDTAAAEAREVLDEWRGRYRVAYALEHHMPKGDGKERPQTPFGGSEWMRWVTHGRILHELENGYYELAHFRGDREPRDLPLAIRRGGTLPWTACNDPDEIDFNRPAPPGKRG